MEKHQRWPVPFNLVMNTDSLAICVQHNYHLLRWDLQIAFISVLSAVPSPVPKRLPQEDYVVLPPNMSIVGAMLAALRTQRAARINSLTAMFAPES